MATDSQQLDPASGTRRVHAGRLAWAAYLTFCALATAVRLPMLSNADALFDADEALNALSIKHVIQRGEPLVFYYGQRYQGLTEGLAALPLVALFGWRAISFMLSPFVAWLLLQGVVFRWVRRNWGPAWGVVWLAVQVFGPVESLWSSLQAHGGHVWVTLIGFDVLERLDRWLRGAEPIGWRRIAVGLLLQCLGAYTFAYYQVFLPLVALQITACGRRSMGSRLALLGVWLAVPVAAVWGLRVVADRVQPDRDLYPNYWDPSDVFDWSQAHHRWRVLRREAVPLALSAEGLLQKRVLYEAGHEMRLADPDRDHPWLASWGQWTFRLLQLSFVAMLCGLTGAAAAAREPANDRLAESRVPDEPAAGRRFGWPQWLALQAVVCLAAFVATQQANQWSCVRYLAPLQPVAALSLVAACRSLWEIPWSDRAGRLACRAVALAVFVFPVGFCAALDTVYFLRHGFVTDDGRLGQIDSPSLRLAAWLEEHGYSGMVGYAENYWLGYSTSFLSGERVRVTPPPRLPRIPDYDAEAARLTHPLAFSLESSPIAASPPDWAGLRFATHAVLEGRGYRIIVWAPVESRPMDE